MSYVDKNKQREYQRVWARNNKTKKLDRHERYRKEYEEFMSTKKCNRCPESHIGCLGWHHINPKNKLYEISSKKARAPLSTLMREIDKCECLCENCHRKLHYDLRRNNMNGPIIRAIPKPGGPDPLPLGPKNGKKPHKGF